MEATANVSIAESSGTLRKLVGLKRTPSDPLWYKASPCSEHVRTCSSWVGCIGSCCKGDVRNCYFACRVACHIQCASFYELCSHRLYMCDMRGEKELPSHRGELRIVDLQARRARHVLRCTLQSDVAVKPSSVSSLLRGRTWGQ